MTELSAEIRLRPTRIGFLVAPTNLAAVRVIMRACSCLWGGLYNPIIPVFRRVPDEWSSDTRRPVKGVEITKGYIRFFEPDVYVEAEPGLLEKAGLGALRRQNILFPQVITLKEFFEPEKGQKWSEPAFGLSVYDALVHIFKTEQRFVQRDKCHSLYVSPARGTAATEAMFGAYPGSGPIKYVEEAYLEVYRPEIINPGPDAWRKVFLDRYVTPLRVTRYGVDVQRYWYHDPVVFVFDPGRATDLIDLWNLRLEPRPVLPVPLNWFDVLGEDLQKILRAEYRPVIGNPSGLMHNAVIEFSRSIPRAHAESLSQALGSGTPKGAFVVKYWRNPVWVERRDDFVRRDDRIKVSVKERQDDLVVVDESGPTTSFVTLAPDFAERYSRSNCRWVNTLNISRYGTRDVGTALPFNTFDRSWPPGVGGMDVPIGGDGWVFQQRYSGWKQHVHLLNAKDSIIGSLQNFGIEAQLSEPGHIARQMLEQLGGLWGVHLLADVDTLKLLNKMAGGLRRKSNVNDTVEEHFELRTAPVKEWADLISRRRAKRSLPRYGLEDFTKRNIVRLGLETDCPHCQAKNWSTLTDVDYHVACERCLKPYDFPQAGLRAQNKNFTYRVVGPFSVPDYGRGSYGALLTLRALERFRASLTEMVFATAMNLSFNGINREVDFVAWYADDWTATDLRRPPQLVIGEAKSLGKGSLITRRDVSQLKSVAERLPGAVIVISVLRDHFTQVEKKLLESFVNWGRRLDDYDEQTNPIILFTAHELTLEHFLQDTWRALGGDHEKFSGYNNVRSLSDLADATQQIYLGVAPFTKFRGEKMRRRYERQMENC